MTITEELARWIGSWRERGFPDDVLDAARTFALDWTASALAGRGTEPGRAILQYAHGQPEGGCEIVGEEVGRSAEVAAFVNGALSHIVEMDDVDRVSVVHPGAVVLPAARAVFQRDGGTGRELLSAVVAGYEVAVRFGAAVGRKHYYHFHNTSTCGVFGAAVAAGWLLGLDEKQLTWALGSAGTMAFGLWEFNTEGSMSKHLHTGHAASSGLRAADLASHGFTGAKTIVEGDRGFFAGLAPEGTPETIVASLPREASGFALPTVSLKPHASCRHTHAAIDAALTLRESLNGRIVRSGRVAVYQAAADLCDNPRPKTPYEAKFSLQYCVNRALATGSTGLSDFSPGDITSLPVPIDVVVDPGLDARFPAQFPARLSLTIDDGSVLEEEVLFPLGDPEKPLTRAQVEAKLFELALFGGVADEKARAYVEELAGW